MELNLKKIREKNGFSQRKVAEYLKVATRTYSNYESGKSKPPVKNMIKLAILYDTSVDYLAGLTNKIEPNKRSEFFNFDIIK